MSDQGNVRLKTFVLLLIGLAPAELNRFYNPLLVHFPPVFWSVDAFRFVVLPLIVLFAGFRWRLFTLSDLGFHRRVFGSRNFAIFLGAMILIPAVMQWIDPHAQKLAFRLAASLHWPPVFSYQQMEPSGPRRFFIVIYFAVTAGFTEEFYYRGLTRFVCGRGFIRSCMFVIVSSLLFGPPHLYGGAANVIDAEIFALEAALIYLAVGSLWPLIVAHILIDFGYFS